MFLLFVLCFWWAVLYTRHLLHVWEKDPSSLALPEVSFFLSWPPHLAPQWKLEQFQAFEEHYTVFYQETCQCVMYFPSISLGGSKCFDISTLSPPFSLSYLHLFVCVSLLALAKRTKASTQHCDWTKSSTFPLSWTPHWSVISIDLFLFSYETWF